MFVVLSIALTNIVLRQIRYIKPSAINCHFSGICGPIIVTYVPPDRKS